MKIIEINATKRTDLGKKSTKALRKDGLVPCSLYGHKAENKYFSVSEKDLHGLVYTPSSHIVHIKLDGQLFPCILKDIQFHPVKDNILHVDFSNIAEDKPVAIDIPLKIEGHAEGVKQGGKLQIVRRKIRISALSKDLPDIIPIDVSELHIGKSISVGDLKFEKLNVVTPKKEVICTVKMTRATATDEAAAAAAATAAAPAAGAAAPAAGAAAPAAGAAAPAADAKDDKAKKK